MFKDIAKAALVSVVTTACMVGTLAIISKGQNYMEVRSRRKAEAKRKRCPR